MHLPAMGNRSLRTPASSASEKNGKSLELEQSVAAYSAKWYPLNSYPIPTRTKSTRPMSEPSALLTVRVRVNVSVSVLQSTHTQYQLVPSQLVPCPSLLHY